MASVGIEFLNHEIYGGGLWAQMVFGEGFEEQENGHLIPLSPRDDPSQWGFIGCQGGRSNDTTLTSGVSGMWLGVREGAAASGTGTFALNNNNALAFTGNQYQTLSLPALPQGAVSARLGLANYGLNCQLGMVFEAGLQYDGSVYLRAPAGSAGGVVTAYAAIESQQGTSSQSVTLAETPLRVPADGQWHRMAFSLSADEAVGCGAMPEPGNAQRAVNTCFGRFVVALRADSGDAAQSLDVDLAELLPGTWGLVDQPAGAAIGLPARRDIAELFQREGIKHFRNGGSMDNRATYRWKDFRGPRDTRQPYQGLWYQQQGLTQSRRFAMFEIVDLCSVIGCRPVLTLNNLETPADMADLVEYCWGNASTVWGQQRIADGHTAVYDVDFIEIGNEQGLDNVLLDTYINITQAMDARSRAIGAPLFKFAIGHNLQLNEVTTQPQRNMTAAFIRAAGALQGRGYWDFHIPDGETGGSWLEDLVVAFQALCGDLQQQVWAVVFEENGGDHGLLRGVGHAAFSNVFMRHGDIAVVHGFADAIEAWQGMDAEQAFPQGQIFFTPNASWLQPPGHAIAMVTDSFATYYLNTTLGSSGSGIDIVALTNATAGSAVDSIVLRIVNYNPEGSPTQINLDFGASGWTPKTTANAVVLNDVDSPMQPNALLQNTPADTAVVLPRQTVVDLSTGLMVPSMSFMTVFLESA